MTLYLTNYLRSKLQRSQCILYPKATKSGLRFSKNFHHRSKDWVSQYGNRIKPIVNIVEISDFAKVTSKPTTKKNNSCKKKSCFFF